MAISSLDSSAVLFPWAGDMFGVLLQSIGSEGLRLDSLLMLGSVLITFSSRIVVSPMIDDLPLDFTAIQLALTKTTVLLNPLDIITFIRFNNSPFQYGDTFAFTIVQRYRNRDSRNRIRNRAIGDHFGVGDQGIHHGARARSHDAVSHWRYLKLLLKTARFISEGQLTVLQTSAKACSWLGQTTGWDAPLAVKVVVPVVRLMQVLIDGIIGTGTTEIELRFQEQSGVKMRHFIKLFKNWRAYFWKNVFSLNTIVLWRIWWGRT